MKATQILNQVLYLNCTEQQGTTTTDERWGVAFAVDYFGAGAVVTGLIKADTEYFYSYCEPLKGVADAIIAVDGCKVYLYEIE